MTGQDFKKAFFGLAENQIECKSVNLMKLIAAAE